MAAMDAGFPQRGICRAAAVLFRMPGLVPVEQAVVELPTVFPYVPGLLSFRELPAILQALGQLSQRPDLILCDGQGIAHPRRLGVASHLGLLVEIPTIGIGKSRLIGRHDEPGPHKGDWVPLLDGEERIGTVLRTRAGVKPLYVSPGHRMDHTQAIEWTLASLGRFRLPEPIRAADRLASQRATRG
jgi:deoxyribonuclease V